MAVLDTIVIQHKHIIAFKCCLFTLKCEYEYRSLHRQNTPIYFSCAVDCLCDLPCLSAQTTLPSGRHPMFLRYSGLQQPVIFPCNVAETQYKGMITQSSHNRNQRARGLMHKLAIARAALCMAVRRSILGIQLCKKHTAFSGKIRHTQKSKLQQWRFVQISYPDIAAFYNTAYIAAKK